VSRKIASLILLSSVLVLSGCGSSGTDPGGGGGNAGGGGLGAAGGGAGVGGREGACSSNQECLDGEYCASGPSSFPGIEPTDPAWACEGLGVCEPVPTRELTTGLEPPVCLCDGTTWLVFENFPGVRPSAIGVCDCVSNTDCAEDEFCNAITCDGPGHCEPLPALCENGTAIVGCDAEEYESLCAAHAAGVRVPYPAAFFAQYPELSP